MKRRTFLQSLGVVSAASAVGIGNFPAVGNQKAKPRPVNKRDIVLNLIHSNEKQDYYPGGFFIHFPEEDHFGPTAVDKHLEYFRFTGLDFLKIQYERRFPLIEKLQKPSDWADVPLLKKDFYEAQLKVIEGIVKKGKKEALVIPTVYSPLSFAGHFTGYKHHIDHLNEDPEAVKKGLEIITESTLIFVKECIKLGVDGFFQATQGGEAHRFKHEGIFENYIKPYDLIVAQEADIHCECNILHIHAGEGLYNDYSAFVDYPGHMINCGLQLNGSRTTPKEIFDLLGRPFMGGLERAGIIYSGSQSEIENEVKRTIDKAPEKFVLGATCTLPSDTDWENIKIAADTAHNYV